MSKAEERPLAEQSPYKPTIVPIQNDEGTDYQSIAKKRQYITAIIVNISGLAAGSVYGWPSPSGPLLMSTEDPIFESSVSKEHFSWIASINMLTGILGTVLFGVLADRLGRRQTGLVVAVPFVLSWVLIGLGNHLAYLYAARILAGIGAGGVMVVCPLYVGETAEDAHRGALGTFLAVGINSGILFSFVVGALVGYRVLPFVCMLLPCIYFLGLLKLPETPVYHMKRGRIGSAQESLEWYRGGAGPHVEAEVAVMHAAAKQDRNNSASLGDLFTHRGSLRALFQSVGLMLNQQFCGCIAVISYTEEIFKASGTTVSPVVATILVGAMQAVMTYLSSFLVGIMGRKTLMVISNVLMGTCLATLGGCFYAKSINFDISGIGFLPVACMCIYIVSFAMGMGPIPLVLLGETYATKVRSLATSISIAFQLIAAFVSTKFFAALSDWVGLHGSLWFFATCCLLGTMFVIFYVIETKDKGLDVILREFNGESLDDPDVLGKESPLVNSTE